MIHNKFIGTFLSKKLFYQILIKSSATLFVIIKQIEGGPDLKYLGEVVISNWVRVFLLLKIIKKGNISISVVISNFYWNTYWLSYVEHLS